MEALLRLSMSGIHSPRPLLHVSVTLVVSALCAFFPSEFGHTPLSQYQGGSDVVIVQLLCLTGNVEARFCVFHVVLIFSLTYVMDQSLLRFIQLKLLFLTYSLKQGEKYIEILYRNYGLFEFH